MKYGIHTHHRDTVPGYKDSWDTEEWFDRENERDERFAELIKPPVLDPIEQIIEQNMDGQWDEQTHHKINK